MTEYPILDASGTPVAIHRRIEGDDGKRFTWSLPDCTSGLGGRPVADLPLYGELAAGRLRSLRVGRRRLVPSGAIAEYVARDGR